jgi:hypothetical protein
MYCSSFSIYKPKSDEEVAEDGEKQGNRKMVPVIARNGAGLDAGDYINMKFDGDFGRIEELKTRKEFKIENKDKFDSTFETDIDDENDIPFADE